MVFFTRPCRGDGEICQDFFFFLSILSVSACLTVLLQFDSVYKHDTLLPECNVE